MKRKTDDQIIMDYLNKSYNKQEQPKKDTRKKSIKKEEQKNYYQDLLDDKVYGILGG